MGAPQKLQNSRDTKQVTNWGPEHKGAKQSTHSLHEASVWSQVQGRLSAKLLDKFRRLGVQYVRYLHDDAGTSLNSVFCGGLG